MTEQFFRQGKWRYLHTREKIKPEINQNYQGISVEKLENPNFLSKNDLPKILKDIVGLNKVRQSLTQRHLPSSSTISSRSSRSHLQIIFLIKMSRIPSKRSSTLVTTITNYAEAKDFIVLDSTRAWRCLILLWLINVQRRMKQTR